MEDGKHRSRRDDADRKEGYKRSDRERNGEKHSERERNKDKDREKEREEKSDRNRVREKSKEREIEKKDRDYRRSEKERNSEQYKDSRNRDSRDKGNDNSKKRHRDDRERGKDKEKDEREKLKEKIRDRDRERKRRDYERVRYSDSDDERDQKRRRREDSVRGKERNKDKYKDDDRERERNKDNHRYRDDEDVGRRNKGDRHRDEDEDVKSRKKIDTKKSKNDESDEETKDKEDMEEEQRRLDEEMEKRRRRVQEWQELKRKKEESENEKRGEEKNEVEPKSGKKWTLEGEESDDELDGPSKSSIFENGDIAMAETGNKNLHDGEAMDIDKVEANVEDEVDPLDAFMNTLVVPDAENLSSKTDNSIGIGKEAKDLNIGTNKKKSNKGSLGRIIPGDDSDADNDEVGDDDENQIDDEDDDEFMKRVKKTKVEKLSVVDHSKIQYPHFRKDFYREVREISLMTAEEVAAYRKELELKIRGKDVPKPVKTWNQTGLTRNVLEVLKKLGYEKPMPIQAQSLPIIMSGRDCIGIAKTGSGKTLAFVLPMLRHIKDQPPLASGDGPIGLIMAPTRELVQQIHADIRKFSKVLALSCVPVYGGSGVAQQISDLKRGTEIVVCTPGRMIDILCTSGGKITNLSRVTYLVMDEADRMFDMGFEPQITRIVQNTRPDRQTVLFSATFPRQVEFLARKVLNKPVEIQVGGRSVVNKDIAQSIEVRPEGERFLRLLELLGEWYEKGKILVFVHSQEKCDSLFKELLRHGYPCLSLHGAKDQTDRESTISDFKSNVCNLLIATSVAARGLDVKELELVVNFDAPNHYEDYVHRVGRTGRAGRKGVAVTFISEEEDRYAPDLVKALDLSEQAIPEDLKNLASGFMAKVSQGTEHAHGTGYGGSGFKFNEEEEEARKAAKKAQAREYGFEEYYKSDSDSEDDGIRKAGGDLEHSAALAQAAALAAATKASIAPMSMSLANSGALATGGLTSGTLPGETWVGGTTVSGLPGTALPVSGLGGAFPVPNDAAARVQALAAALNLQHNLAKIQKDAMPEHYEAELEINDFPQNARWKVTHKETLGPISEWTGAAITTRGQYYPPGKIPGPGERKLYLFIEGPTESSVKKGKAELKRVLEDYTAQSLSLPGSGQPGKYSVL